MCNRNLLSKILKLLIILFLLNNFAYCVHLKGTFKSNEFFKFLVKFGFQKTNRHQRESTYGYMFGNITSSDKFNVPITFAVLDKSHFLRYYQNRDKYDKSEACRRMFSKLNETAFHPKCSPHGNDYLRRIPCPKHKLCIDEDAPFNVVKGHQFTYVLQNLRQPS